MLSLRKYAEHRKALGLRGGTLQAVQKALATGRISAVEGLIDPAVADQAWAERTDPMKQRSTGSLPAGSGLRRTEDGLPADADCTRVQTEPEGLRRKEDCFPISAAPNLRREDPAEQRPATAAANSGEDPEQKTLADAQLELVEKKVEKADLELARMRGQVLPVEKIEHAVGELIVTAKNRLMLVADSVADQVAGTTDPIACRNIIEHEIRLALEEISQWRLAA